MCERRLADPGSFILAYNPMSSCIISVTTPHGIHLVTLEKDLREEEEDVLVTSRPALILDDYSSGKKEQLMDEQKLQPKLAKESDDPLAAARNLVCKLKVCVSVWAPNDSLWVGLSNGTLLLYDTKPSKGAPHGHIAKSALDVGGNGEGITAAALTSTSIIVGLESGLVLWLDLINCSILRNLPKGYAPITRLSLSYTFTWMVVCTAAGSIRLIRIEQLSRDSLSSPSSNAELEIMQVADHHFNGITGLGSLPKSRIVTCSLDGTLRVWDPSSRLINMWSSNVSLDCLAIRPSDTKEDTRTPRGSEVSQVIVGSTIAGLLHLFQVDVHTGYLELLLTLQAFEPGWRMQCLTFS